MKVGIDICKLQRFKDKLSNDKFINRILTENEKREFNNRNSTKLEYLAGRFSAKEAFSKAIGTGIGKISFKEIEITNDKLGNPHIKLYGDAHLMWNSLFKYSPEISISHDGDFVVTVVAIEDKQNQFSNFNNPFKLKERDRRGHKGSFGKVGILGGSKGMLGSAYLSSMACLRTGSGLTYTGVCKDIYNIMQIKSLENIVKLVDFDNFNSIEEFIENLDSLGIGPGLADNLSIEGFLYIFKHYNKPIIIDADALNTISNNLNLLFLNDKLILTPHEMEFSRLSRIKLKDITENRVKYAKEFANKYKVILVLKGANTVVTDGLNVYVNESGTNGLATAGSGDVLTGIITSLVGQGYDLFEGASLGVFIHGLCGNFLQENLGTDGIIARDILNIIPKVIKSLRE